MRFNLYRVYGLNAENHRSHDSNWWIGMRRSGEIPMTTLEEKCDYYPELDVWMTKDTKTSNVIVSAPETSQYFNLVLLMSRYDRSIPHWVSTLGDDIDTACADILINTWKTFHKHRHANEN